MHTGEVIKHLRKQSKMTQEELATLLDVKKSSIQKYECGKVQNLKLERIQKLCEIFEISPFVFIYPDIWAKAQMPREYNSELCECIKIYFSLNEKGKKKVMQYIMDIGDIERYQQSKKINQEK